MGGLARLGKVLDDTRASSDGVLFVDAGDALSGPQVLPEQRSRRARLVLDAYAALGIDGMAIGELNRSAGVALGRVRQGGIFRRAGIRVGVLSADLEAAPAPTLDSLGRSAAALRQRGAQLVVALLHAGARKAVPLLQPGAAGIDIAVVSHNAFGTPRPLRAGSTWVVEVPAQGKQIGRLDLHIVDGKLEFVDVGGRAELVARIKDGERELVDLEARYGKSGEALAAFLERRRAELQRTLAAERTLLDAPDGPALAISWLENQLVPLGADLPDQPRMAALIEQYKHDVALIPVRAATGTAALTSTGAPTSTTAISGGYAGGAACKRCHPDAYSFWSRTKHAHAWQALVKDGQQRDPACVLCHVTANTVAMIDVQCEACHGPGRAHADNPAARGLVRRDTSEPLCTVCHRPPQAKEWDYPTFRSATLGPGHGGSARARLSRD